MHAESSNTERLSALNDKVRDACSESLGGLPQHLLAQDRKGYDVAACPPATSAVAYAKQLLEMKEVCSEHGDASYVRCLHHAWSFV